eukprot:jgi/Bigna1/130022/aug1.10_g4730
MYTPDPEEIRMRWLRRRGPKPKPGVKKGILRARVMILGDCGVGKSTLLKVTHALRLFRNMLTGEKLPASDKSERKGRRFSPCEPTVGVELVSRSLMVKGNRIEMAIWDFSGDPVFKLVRDQLYRYCQLGILVFDVTKRESFVNLGKWIKEAEAGGAGGGRSGEKLTFVICGAKADLRDKRTVPKTEAQIWARTRGTTNPIYESLKAQNIQDFMNDNGDDDESSGGGLGATMVDPRTCITRTDLEKEVLKILKRLKIEGDAERKRQQKEREQKRRESIHKAVSAEIAQCPLTEAIMEKRKSTTGQSNGSVWRGVSERGDHYLGSQASANAILKAYKKALVLIHPDKFDLENYEAYAKATETFKAVNAAYVAFKNHT